MAHADNEKLAPVAFFQPSGFGYLTCPRCHKKPLAINGRGQNSGDLAQSEFEIIQLFCGCGFSAMYQRIRPPDMEVS